MMPPVMHTGGFGAAPRLALALTAGMLVAGLGIEILGFHTVLPAGLPLGVLLVYGLARRR